MLKTFIQVNETGNVSVLGGSPRQNFLAWEKIVQANSKALGSLEFSNYQADNKQLTLLRADYVKIKAYLTKLNFVVDDEAIEFLRKKGYKLNTTSASAYHSSLLVAIRASDNLLSRITLKQAEIERKQSKENSAPTFQELLASLSIALGFSVSEDVKLSWFNEANKVLKAKNNSRNGRQRRNK